MTDGFQTISGLTRSLVLDRLGEEIVSMTVELTVSNTAGGSAFLGDLFVYLSDGTKPRFSATASRES